MILVQVAAAPVVTVMVLAVVVLMVVLVVLMVVMVVMAVMEVMEVMEVTKLGVVLMVDVGVHILVEVKAMVVDSSQHLRENQTSLDAGVNAVSPPIARARLASNRPQTG